MLKLLSIQPLSLYKNGGASRVLRRLYKGKEESITSLTVVEQASQAKQGNIKEQFVVAFPLQRRWMRWKLRNLVIWLREEVFRARTISLVQQAVKKINYEVIHLVFHGPYAMAVYTDALLKGKQLWVSFHDHFSTAGTSFADTQKVWQQAHRRLVISPEMGLEYQRLFGHADFEIITDGVTADEIAIPRVYKKDEPVVIYFSGLLHIEYYPLFEVLAGAINILTKQGFKFELIMRGTQELSFLNDQSFTVRYKTDFISDEAIKQEMDAATILYLPIKFTTPDFYLYSLSTKMVGYLGGAGGILYHGPADSAACRLLQNSGAAVCCNSLTLDEMVAAIQKLLIDIPAISGRAKELARTRFDMAQIQARFWQHPHKS